MFNIDKSIKKMIGIKQRGGKNDWDGDGVKNRKDCQPHNTMRQDDVKWPNEVMWKGKKVKVYKENIPTLPYNINRMINDYSHRCPYCKTWFQTDDSTMYGDFLICPKCKKPSDEDY